MTFALAAMAGLLGFWLGQVSMRSALYLEIYELQDENEALRAELDRQTGTAGEG